MTLDVVYYVRPGERNEELRYSLRSLTHLPHDRVWVVGHKPSWVTGVEHIPGNRAGGRERNAIDNLRLACERIEADRFAIFNDDFYVMDPLLAVPTYHAGPLRERIRSAGGTYARQLRATLDVLTEMGYSDPLAWTLHIPVVVWREKLLRILEMLDESLSEWRTMYGNLMGVVGEQAPDVKVRTRRDPLPGGPFLSSSDRTFPRLSALLESRFPEPSPYEAIAVRRAA